MTSACQGVAPYLLVVAQARIYLALLLVHSLLNRHCAATARFRTLKWKLRRTTPEKVGSF
jgi:hypothetical protein